MKPNFLQFLVVFMLLSIVSTAQDSVYFYDLQKNAARPEAATIISIARKEDSGWMRMDYFTYSKKMQEVGHYTDHTFKIKNGEFTSYYANEQLESNVSYSNNKRTGFHQSYYPNTMMLDSCKYINDMPTGYCNTWYTDGSIKTILQMDTLGDGTGIAVGYFPNGTISFKGRIAKGMRKIGSWTYYHENGNKASVLKFPTLDETTLNQPPELKLDTLEGLRYDSLVEYSSAICYNEDGVEQAGCDFKNSLPQFKGGIPAWINYLTNKMYGLADEFVKDNKAIVYTSYFTVSTDGKVTEALLSNKANPALDRTIGNIFVGSTKWLPAMHYNRKIPFMHKQAIVLAPIVGKDAIGNLPPRKVTTQMIAVPMGDGNRSSNPLNKNQFQ